jgi:CRP-like cAMP-binding protein
MTDLYNFLDQYYKISPASKLALDEICTSSSYKKNELLQNFGQTCKTIYFLKEGIARIFYLKDGIDITESFSFQGNIIARVESLFTGRPSQKAIQILEDAEIIAINATKLFKLYDTHHDIERLFRIIFEHAYVDTVNRIESIQFHSADERYKALLAETNYVQQIPLKHIASYLGITQVSLSRIRANIK